MVDDSHQRARLKAAIARRLRWRSAVCDPRRRGNAAPQLATLRACGYLDVVDGVPVGDADSAGGAIAALMADRRDQGAQG